tara:strand:- start:437 stop:628 length:192 start_codon:yes stop_codon:yes gene_type:complete
MDKSIKGKSNILLSDIKKFYEKKNKKVKKTAKSLQELKPMKPIKGGGFRPIGKPTAFKKGGKA